jgi:hypothetical protein
MRSITVRKKVFLPGEISPPGRQERTTDDRNQVEMQHIFGIWEKSAKGFRIS